MGDTGVQKNATKKVSKLGRDEGERGIGRGAEIRWVLLRDRMQQSGDEIDIGSWASRGKRYGLGGRFADIGHSILANPDSLTRP